MSNVRTEGNTVSASDRLRELRERAVRSIQQREASLAALDNCQRELVAARQEASQLSGIVHDLRARLQRFEQGGPEAAQTREQIAALRADLEERAKDAHARKEQLRELESSREQAKRRIAGLEAESQGARAQTTRLEQQAESLRSRNADLAKGLKKAQDEAESLRQSMQQQQQAAQAQEQTARNQAEAQVANLGELNEALTQARERIEQIERVLVRKDAQVVALQEQLESERATVQEHTKALEQRTQETEAWESRHERLRAESEARVAQVVSLQSEVDELRSTVASLRQESEQHESQHGDLERRLRAEEEIRDRTARVFHQVGEVFGAALRRAVGGLAWVSLTDAWSQRVACLPQPPDLPSDDADALAAKFRHWFVDTGLSREIVVRREQDGVSVEITGAAPGDDGATIVAQAAVIVPLLLPSENLALRDISDGADRRRLMFRSERRAPRSGVTATESST